MQQIIVHPADTGGCYWYRLKNPSSILQENGIVRVHETNLSLSSNEYLSMRPYRVFTQRQTELSQINYIQSYKQLLPATPVVMDLDDLLWNVPTSNGYKFNGDNRKAIQRNLQQCDIIIASTEALKAQIFDRVKEDKIRVMHNMVSHQYFTPPRQRDTSRKLRIGWAGSSTHTGDLNEIFHVIKDTANIVEWVFFGWVPESLRPYVALHEGCKVDQYLPSISALNLDVAVAPLEYHVFNECKSHLKLLEFSALGVPTISTNITPYVENKGILISSTKQSKLYKEWMQAIKLLANDEDTRYRMANDSYEWAHTYQLDRRENIAKIIQAWMI